MEKRRKIDTLSEQQNHRCCYCGVRFEDGPPTDNHPFAASIEHVRRICDGGKRKWSNEVAACRRCNTARGDVSPEVYYAARSTEGRETSERCQKGLSRSTHSDALYEMASESVGVGEPALAARTAYFLLACPRSAKRATLGDVWVH